MKLVLQQLRTVISPMGLKHAVSWPRDARRSMHLRYGRAMPAAAEWRCAMSLRWRRGPRAAHAVTRSLFARTERFLTSASVRLSFHWYAMRALGHLTSSSAAPPSVGHAKQTLALTRQVETANHLSLRWLPAPLVGAAVGFSHALRSGFERSILRRDAVAADDSDIPLFAGRRRWLLRADPSEYSQTRRLIHPGSRAVGFGLARASKTSQEPSPQPRPRPARLLQPVLARAESPASVGHLEPPSNTGGRLRPIRAAQQAPGKAEGPGAAMPATDLAWRLAPIGHPVAANAAAPALRGTAVWADTPSHAVRSGAVGAQAHSVPQQHDPSRADVLDAAAVDRLTDDVVRRIERKLRIERERRGL